VLLGRLASDALILAVQAGLLLSIGRLLGFRVSAGLAGMAGIAAIAVAFGLAVAVASSWLALIIGDPETAERVLFFPAIAITFVSSAFAPVGLLAGWTQPVAADSPVTAAANLVRALADGGPAAVPLVEFGCWLVALTVVPGAMAVRRWQASD